MVLPLIPVVLIAVGAVTGGSGAALGGLGALDFKKASDRRKAAMARYEDRSKKSEESVQVTNGRLKDLGEQQQKALNLIVLRMHDFLLRNERQIRESEKLLVDGVDAQSNEVPGLGRLGIDATAWLGGAIGSGITSIGTSAGLGMLAGAVGSASTGTAIGALSGVAAENAMIAWFGGGSLAAGGGGMALGGLAFNFVTIGPAILVGGLVTKGQGAKELTKAMHDEAKLETAIAEMDKLDAQLDAIQSRADELSDVLTGLTSRALTALDLLESEPFEARIHAERFQRALKLAVAVKDVAAAPVLDESGELTDESARLTVKYRQMAEGDSGGSTQGE